MATPQPTVPSITSSTNLGPLTTSLSFPANCLNNLYDLQTTGLGVTWTYETQGCAISTCCPSNRFYTVGWGWLSSYYSPAVCPSQYKSCAPYTGLSTSAGETAILCCPENYDCPGGTFYWACQSGLTSNTPVTVLSGLYNQRSVSTRQFSAIPDWTSYQVAYPIQIRFKSEELSISGDQTIVIAAAATNSAEGSSSSETSLPSFPDGSSNGQGKSRGLSTGARSGIGIGIGLGLLLIGTIIAWFIARQRRNRVASAPVAAPMYQNPPQNPPTMDNPLVFTEHKPWNGQVDNRYAQNTQELPNKSQGNRPEVHELGVSHNEPWRTNELP